MAVRKLNGAALAAELSGLPARDIQPFVPKARDNIEASEGLEGEDAQGVTSSGTGQTSRRSHEPKSRGGRPSKAGVDGIPVNVRLSQDDHLALTKLSAKLITPGRPLPTVQDIVRSLLRGALSEPDMALRLCQKMREVA